MIIYIFIIYKIDNFKDNFSFYVLTFTIEHVVVLQIVKSLMTGYMFQLIRLCERGQLITVIVLSTVLVNW